MKDVITLVLAAALGVSSYISWSEVSGAAIKDERIKKLEADVRTYAGKYLDAMEMTDEKVETARAEKSMELWTAQQALEKCRVGK